MKKKFLAGLALGALLLAPAISQASLIYTFDGITNNNAGDTTIGETQLSVTVYGSADMGSLLSDQVLFQFNNSGPAASSITDVYFDDGTLLGIASIINSTGVAFSQWASPPELPGWNNITPIFNTTAGFLADSNPPAQPNGVNPGESLGIVFNLQNGMGYDNVLGALSLSSGNQDDWLRIGIHVQGFASGGSESFVNDPTPNNPVPEPATMLLMGMGLVGLATAAKRRRAKKN